MVSPILNYGGPRAGLEYQPYDGKFTNQLIRQVMYRHGGFHRGLLSDAAYVVDVITKGIFSRIVEFCRVNMQIYRGEIDSKFPIQLREELVPIQEEQYQDGRFTVNGVNSSDIIRSLDALTGLPIAELERRMLPDDRTFQELQPGEYFGSNSDFGGFIKPGESLLDIMARDNDYVLGQGYTHQKVAKPMLQVMNALVLSRRHRMSILTFELNGKTFELELKGFPMEQDSPFNDGISSSGFNIRLTNTDNGEKFFFPPLCAVLIHRYGFYEGEVIYRIEPQRAIEFFQ